jgi:hypothetical protein
VHRIGDEVFHGPGISIEIVELLLRGVTHAELAQEFIGQRLIGLMSHCFVMEVDAILWARVAVFSVAGAYVNGFFLS